MNINEKMGQIIKSEGRTQKWVMEEMNKVNPQLKLNAAIFSAIITGKRGVSGDELIAFCKAMKRDPAVFMEISA